MSKLQEPEIIDYSQNSNRDDSGPYELVPSSSHSLKTQIRLTWNNLNFTVHTKEKSLHILKGVSGFANPGEILAIMGSSGCGKTSLLSIISNQIILQKNQELSGTVEVNGENTRGLDLNAFARYVMQQDILMPTQTPREALTFAAVLKVGGTHEQITDRVNWILSDLHLEKVADNLIGNEAIKGISGGEKKRVCIGLELISEPNILILDEPTSGLDSVTAEVAIRLLKEQARKGRTIITTIHQPSTNIYGLFDRLILMMEGNIIYQGDPKASMRYFGELGYPVPERTNPPDHYMRVLYIANRNALTEADHQKISLFVNTYKKEEDSILETLRGDEMAKLNRNDKAYHAGLLTEFMVLSKRGFDNSMRNPLLFFAKIGQALVTGALLDILFRDLGYGYVQVQNREGLLFFITINTLLDGTQAHAMTIPYERTMMLKDYKEGSYGVCSFFLSKVLVELPSQLIFSLIYTIVVYFAVDFNRYNGSEFFVFYAIVALCHITGSGYGYIAGAISPNVMAAAVMASTVGAPFMMFAGYFSNAKSLSKAFYWIKYLSAYNFAFEAFVINELTDLPIDMSEFTEPPLETLGFTGELWKSICSLLLVELGLILIVLFILKIYANTYKNY